LFVGKQLVLVHGLARRATPPETWQELHAYYRLAEMLDCAVTAVTDDLIPQGVGTSCYSTYSHALLLGRPILRDDVRQIGSPTTGLAMEPETVPYARTRRGPVAVIDLDSTADARPSRGARHRRHSPATQQLSPACSRPALPGGAAPAELQLADVSTTCIALSRLEARMVPRAARSGEGEDAGSIVTGGARCIFARRRTFERADPIGRVPAQHLDWVRSPTLTALPGSGTAMGWEVARPRPDRDNGTSRIRATTAGRSISSSSCGPRRTRLGWASRVARAGSGDLALTLKLWQGTPRAVTLRPQSGNYVDEPPIAALLLAETPDDSP
jgi:hypothetical protein